MRAVLGLPTQGYIESPPPPPLPGYAPNDDSPNFFKTLFTHLLGFHCEEIIIGGDFNLVLDIEKDKLKWRVIKNSSKRQKSRKRYLRNYGSC